ncbi:MAG: HEAT repeat domain-containing protein [Planctomycetaceae bacterium]
MDLNVKEIISPELYDKFFKEIDRPCDDVDLYLLLRAWEYVTAMIRCGPAMEKLYGDIKQRLSDILITPEITQRIVAGLEDSLPYLRKRCGRFMLVNDIGECGEVALRLLRDEEPTVRHHICETLHSIPVTATFTQLERLAQNDPFPSVRAFAAQALAKGEPIKVIPILLHIHETDKEYEEELEFDAVSEYAAFALDEILKTNWINVDLGNGLFMMRPGGRDYISLVQHAKSYLERLKREQAGEA